MADEETGPPTTENEWIACFGFRPIPQHRRTPMSEDEWVHHFGFRPICFMRRREWFASSDLRRMLDFIKGMASDRKLRLFSCACCYRLWHSLYPENRACLEITERFADGLATEQEIAAAYEKAEREALAEVQSPFPNSAFTNAATSVGFASEVPRVRANTVSFWASQAVAWKQYRGHQTDFFDDVELETKDQCSLLRDIFGPLPFGPIVIDPACLTPNVRAIAQAIYEERQFDRLPILADALEEAGVVQPDLLNHCRQPGDHVKGCWALDLVLGRE